MENAQEADQRNTGRQRVKGGSLGVAAGADLPAALRGR